MIFTCDICDNSFPTAQKRNEHIEQHFQMIKCPNCTSLFYGDRAYEYHTTTAKCKKVVEKTKFRCNVCNVKVFDTLEAQKQHEITEHKVHIDTNSIRCEPCGQSFAQLKYLKTHISELHLKSSQYACETCGKHFNRKSNLVEHLLIHENKYLSKCDVCYKSYRTPSALKLHKRTHTGEKPYICDICLEKSYAYNTDLKRHKRTSHGILGKPFPCKICSRVYYEPKLLRYHMKKYHPKEQITDANE